MRCSRRTAAWLLILVAMARRTAVQGFTGLPLPSRGVSNGQTGPRLSSWAAIGTRLASHRHPTEPPQQSTLLYAGEESPYFLERKRNLHLLWPRTGKDVASAVVAGLISLAFMTYNFSPALAENELSAKYGSGIDTSLVDQTCLVNQCSQQAQACLRDDPNCRKGLTCTAKCLGDNACITGCMARYGNQNLDRLLKCTIEDHECIKVAILPGGADPYGQEPRSPAPTVANFDPRSLQGSWYKVVGYNPNYDCYACQRNTFSAPLSSPSSSSNNRLLWTTAGGMGAPASSTINHPTKLSMEVEFSMPHLLPDGSPPPPSNVRENIRLDEEKGQWSGPLSIGLNDYYTRETMIFDQTPASSASRHSLEGATEPIQRLVLGPGTLHQQQVQQQQQQSLVSYARTAHSEGEMFGLKFWENWYIIGENDADAPEEFKFIYYNGKTRQNTYEGAFVYSRSQSLSPESMKKVYRIAKDAGMNPDQFCRIRNGCFGEDPKVLEPTTGLGAPSNPFRGILASTRVSQLLGVEPVAARDTVRRGVPTAEVLKPKQEEPVQRAWWYELGDYLENPHRHFKAMDELRLSVDWPEDV